MGIVYLSRHQRRRQQLLDQGLCPVCAGRELLIPGMKFGRACQLAAQRRMRCRRRPEATEDGGPDTSVWAIQPDGLALALAEADRDLAVCL